MSHIIIICTNLPGDLYRGQGVVDIDTEDVDIYQENLDPTTVCDPDVC